MFDFFHNIGVGIAAAFMAFTGAFHTQTPPVEPIKTIPVEEVKTNLTDTKQVQVVPPVTTQFKSDNPVSPKQPTIIDTKAQTSAQAEIERVARINALKQQQAIESKLESQREAQAHADGLAQDKADKLNAVNLKIANLNAKYAKDTAAIYNQAGVSRGAADAGYNELTRIYNSDYNTLMAEYQQILYSK